MPFACVQFDFSNFRASGKKFLLAIQVTQPHKHAALRSDSLTALPRRARRQSSKRIHTPCTWSTSAKTVFLTALPLRYVGWQWLQSAAPYCSAKLCSSLQPRQFIWMCKDELASCDLSYNQIVCAGQSLVLACNFGHSINMSRFRKPVCFIDRAGLPSAPSTPH